MKEYKVVYNKVETDVVAEINNLATQGYVLRFCVPEGPTDLGQFVMEREKPEPTP
jgi:hypothetical protein